MGNIRSNIQELNENDKAVVVTDTIRGHQSVTFITAKGLYKILFRSRKPIAEQFQNWVCDVVEELRLHLCTFKTPILYNFAKWAF
jgi:prophage antirepressor-like protein